MAWVRWRWQTVAYAALLLCVIRPASVLLVVRLRQLPSTQRRLVAWFGIRGVGSLFYLALVVDSGMDAGIARQLVDATLPAIALSILLHGISATPLMGWYQRRHVLQRRERRLAARRGPR
jgi:NhaP-type Na+/H+ or K+/H+ antiporter